MAIISEDQTAKAETTVITPKIILVTTEQFAPTSSSMNSALKLTPAAKMPQSPLLALVQASVQVSVQALVAPVRVQPTLHLLLVFLVKTQAKSWSTAPNATYPSISLQHTHATACHHFQETGARHRTFVTMTLVKTAEFVQVTQTDTLAVVRNLGSERIAMLNSFVLVKTVEIVPRLVTTTVVIAHTHM